MKRKQNKPLTKTAIKKLIKKLEKKADKFLSLYVRSVTIKQYSGLCPFCKVDPNVPVVGKNGRIKRNRWICFHFVRRFRKSVRWDEANVIGACEFCNMRERGNPDPYRAWYIRKFGSETYLAVVDQSTQDFDPTIEFLQAIIDTYQKKLATLANSGGTSVK